MRKWAVRILRDKGVLEEFGTVEAPTHHEAYLAAIKTFNVPIEQQNRLFVRADRD
jgi:hypothetical protein